MRGKGPESGHDWLIAFQSSHDWLIVFQSSHDWLIVFQSGHDWLIVFQIARPRQACTIRVRWDVHALWKAYTYPQYVYVPHAGTYNYNTCTSLHDTLRVERGAARAEDAQGTPTQSHIAPSILVYEG